MISDLSEKYEIQTLGICRSFVMDTMHCKRAILIRIDFALCILYALAVALIYLFIYLFKIRTYLHTCCDKGIIEYSSIISDRVLNPLPQRTNRIYTYNN